MFKNDSFARISKQIAARLGLAAALAGAFLSPSLWNGDRLAHGADGPVAGAAAAKSSEKNAPTTLSTNPVKWVRNDETANEYLDFETARLALIDCINALDEPRLKEALPQLQAPPIREPWPPPPPDTCIVLHLRGCTIDLRQKNWTVNFSDRTTGNLSFGGYFYKNETGQWKARLRGKSMSNH